VLRIGQIQSWDREMTKAWLRRIKILAISMIAVTAFASSSGAAQDVNTIYQQKCAACHGSSGMSDGPASATLQPPPEPFPKALKDKSDEWIAKVIKGGGAAVGLSPMMPPQPSLSDDQVKALAQYVKSLGH
jgi:mono/diheme cytochrome c family protein